MLSVSSTFYLPLHMHSPFSTLLTALRSDLHGLHTTLLVELGQCEAQGEGQREEGEKVYRFFFWLPLAEILMHPPTTRQNCVGDTLD